MIRSEINSKQRICRIIQILYIRSERDKDKRYFLDFYNSLPEKAQQKKTQKTPSGEIEKAKKVIDEADLILFLVDETGFDNELYSLIKDKKHLIVNSKADLVSNREKDKIYKFRIINSEKLI